MNEAVFYSLWKPLLGYAQTRGIDHDTAQDLVMETIYKVIDKFKPERGEILNFAYRVMGNRIKNHYRAKNKSIQLHDELEANNPTPYDIAVMKEQERHAINVLKSLKQQLDKTEFLLLSILQDQMENNGKYNVSEAARSIGMEPLKAHDMLRKIQRKLIVISSDQGKPMFSRRGLEEGEETILYQHAMPEPEFQDLLSIASEYRIFDRISKYLKKSRT